MRYTVANIERQRVQEEDGTPNETESLVDSGTKDSDLWNELSDVYVISRPE